MQNVLALFGAGLAAGALNALAGGGSFVTLPVLIAMGMPSVAANASSTVALWPGGVASAWTYHDGFKRVCGVGAGPMTGVTVAGGLAGSLLLLFTPAPAFDLILPWLLLLATLAFAFGRRIGDAMQGRLQGHPGPVLVTEFVLGVYGGYFGGAVGLMMIAIWSLAGETDLKALSGPRTLMVSAANTVAVLIFVVAGAVRWPETLTMLVGGLVGGIAGSFVGRIVPAPATRLLTLAWTVIVTCVFFVRTYFFVG